MKTYTNLIQHETFLERYNYLRMTSQIGVATFGFDRHLNQSFYTSYEWKKIREKVILRDSACDLGILDRPIYGHIRVHHMNPITVEDFERERFQVILDPEYLICVSLDTHNAIHYGVEKSLKIPMIDRKKGDTRLWGAS